MSVKRVRNVLTTFQNVQVPVGDKNN